MASKGNAMGGNWDGSVSYWNGVGHLDLLRVHGVSALLNDGIESIVGIGGVVDSADGTVGFVEGVVSPGEVSLTFLVLLLDITGVGVLDRVLVGVVRRSLETRKSIM